MLENARLEFGNDAVTLMKLTTNYNKAFHDIYSGTQSQAHRQGGGGDWGNQSPLTN